MKALVGSWRAWEGYWFRPARLFDLACCRIAIVAVLLWYRYDYNRLRGQFEELVGMPAELYNPLPVLHALVWPIDWMYRPDMAVLEAVYVVALVAGFAGLVGLLTNASLLVFALGTLFLQAHAYSYGDLHHTEALGIIAVGLLALAPSGRVLSVDAAARGWIARWRGRIAPKLDTVRARSVWARWPKLLIGWLLALAYFSAAYGKIVPDKGLEWMNGYTLRYYLAQDGLRWGREVGLWLAQQHELAVLLSWVTFVFEGTFWLALLVPPLALLYVAVGVALHTGIFVAMRAPFFVFMALYSVFLPWGRWAEALRRRLGGSPAAPAFGRREDR